MNKIYISAFVLISFVICLTVTHPTEQYDVPKTPAEMGVKDNDHFQKGTGDTHSDLDIDHDEKENTEQENNHIDDSDKEEIEDSASSSSHIFQTILTSITNGEVTKDSLSGWMAQIKSGMTRGTLTSENVHAFLATLKEKLAGTPLVDKCCPFG